MFLLQYQFSSARAFVYQQTSIYDRVSSCKLVWSKILRKRIVQVPQCHGAQPGVGGIIVGPLDNAVFCRRVAFMLASKASSSTASSSTARTPSRGQKSVEIGYRWSCHVVDAELRSRPTRLEAVGATRQRFSAVHHRASFSSRRRDSASLSSFAYNIILLATTCFLSRIRDGRVWRS